jgi:hypothetical protein
MTFAARRALAIGARRGVIRAHRHRGVRDRQPFVFVAHWFLASKVGPMSSPVEELGMNLGRTGQSLGRDPRRLGFFLFRRMIIASAVRVKRRTLGGIMTPGELFDEIRGHYLSRFGDHVDEVVAENPSVAVEVAFRDANGHAVREGTLQLPARSDLVVITNDEAAESHLIETESLLSFDPFEFDWDGLQVSIEPFRWEECQVTLYRSGSFDYRPLVAWFEKWFAETEDGDAESFLGAVHFLSDPTESAGSASLMVDFGSAPVEAVEELFDAVLKSGVERVNLSSLRTSA